MTVKNDPIEFDYLSTKISGTFFISAGFEDRAFEFISKANISSKDSYCVLIGFKFDILGNQDIYNKYQKIISEKFERENIFELTLQQHKPKEFEGSIKSVLDQIPKLEGKIWLDISGLPTYATCCLLKEIRETLPASSQNIIYTSAQIYFPTHDEYLSLKDKSHGEVEFLPPTMAREMSEVLILESFSGHRSKEGTSCLAIFAGYDARRSSGVIESINPSTLLMLYGTPGNDQINWRLDLSKELHSKFETTRKFASETVSTLQLKEPLSKLEKYYENLFEDYDFTIAPVCSKMQTVAVYLFWEKYKEVQLVFPLPIGYSIDRKPQGVCTTYVSILSPSSSFYRDL